MAEYSSSSSTIPTARYVHGIGADVPLVQYSGSSVTTSNRRFLHANHQGSIIAHSDTSGNATVTNAYDAYGIPEPTNDGRFGYTGQVWLPELGLYHYKARMYEPRLGRFLQTDPVGYEDQMNLYAYVHNDPLTSIDPSGKDTVKQEELIWRSIVLSLTPSSPSSGTRSSEVVVNAGVAQASVGFAKDSNGGNAIQVTWGAAETTTNASSVSDLEGLATEVGVSVGDGGQLDVAGIQGEGYAGSSVGASAGTDGSPAGGYAHKTFTTNLIEYQSSGETLESVQEELKQEYDKFGPY